MQVAKLLQKVADICEQNGDVEQAVFKYKEAGEMFSLEKHQQVSSTRCKLKAAEISSMMFEDKQQLKDAISIFDEVAKDYLRNNLMRFSAKNLFIKVVVIMFLLEDDVGAEKSLDEYSLLDTSLNNSTEYRFLKKVIICFREGDKEMFEQECVELNKRMTLDKWWISVLSRMKSLIKGSGNVMEDFNPL
jgi:alpha-soluble NSF attachment protein